MSGPVHFRHPLLRTLVDEHTVIQGALAVLQSATDRLKRRPIPVADLSTLVRFFRDYADTIHHHAEEQVLFADLECASSLRLRRTTQKLATQHLIGRLLVGELTAAV